MSDDVLLDMLTRLASHDAAATDGRWQYVDDFANDCAESFSTATAKAVDAAKPGEYVYEATYWAGYALAVYDAEVC